MHVRREPEYRLRTGDEPASEPEPVDRAEFERVVEENARLRTSNDALKAAALRAQTQRALAIQALKRAKGALDGALRTIEEA